MLSQLTINNYAIVDQLDIDLKAGMTVITGETGAGKSIMLDALGLALGDRADKDVIRADASRAEICATFSIDDNVRAQQWLVDNDFSADENECLLRRVITAEGRSRAYINGQQTTLNELRDLGELLIDIHSQHEHQSLLRSATHQRLLDEYCGLQDEADHLSSLASRWRKLKQQLDELQSSAEANNAQLELLGFQVEELDALGLGPDELEALEDEHQRLHHAGSSLELSQRLLDLCSENDNFNLLQGLSQAQQLLEQLPWKGKHSEEAGKLLDSALIQVEEAVAEINHSLDQFELDPARLEEVEERMRAIHQMARKHRIKPSEIPELHQRLSDELTQMSQADVTAEGLQKELDQLQTSYQTAAASLSTARQSGAARLEKEINGHLAALGMAGARFSLALNTQVSDTPAGSGYEKTEFLVSTNPGQSPKALIRIASGGELSRISLAIQVATAQTSNIPTLVFDEVDVGIGGGVAKTVGELLRSLGERGQVMCVTHQPQVASQGHHHLYVSKQSGKDSTATRIKYLGAEEKIEEVARMLGGDELSDKSLAHAREMIA